MVLGGGAFGRWLGPEGRSLTNGNIVLIKRAQWEDVSYETG